MRLPIFRFALSLTLLLSPAAFAQGMKPDDAFQTGKAADYPQKQTIQGVTIAVKAFNDPDLIKEAFGKPDPLRYGILPVLVVIDNNTKSPISLDRAMIELIRQEVKVEPVPPEDIMYAKAPRRPDQPNRLPIPLPRGKNPLQDQVFQVRALRAKLVPPGESAAGFLYFFITYRPGYTMLLRGLKDMSSGQDLFFFEVPLDPDLGGN